MALGYRPICAIDYDGTIRNGKRLRDEDNTIDPECIEAILELWAIGCHLILWTCREGELLEQAKENLKNNGIFYCFEEFNDNIGDLKELWETNPRKIYADYYIDELNIGGLLDWEKVVEIIKQDEYFTKEKKNVSD